MRAPAPRAALADAAAGVGAGWARVVTDPRAVSLTLAAITGLVFLPSLRNGFVDWDDYQLLVNNPDYRGLGWAQVRWMFTTALLGHYVPLTWLTWGLDYVLWGMNPVGYHLTNLALHAANVVLFFLVAGRLLREATQLAEPARHWGGVTAALFFGLHPLRVESVAWVTERRGVLSGLFFLLTILLYLRAREADGSRRHWLLTMSTGTYLLALASKATVMTLPLVLVLLDVYPLRRLPAAPRAWLTPAAGRVWLEKVPYLVLALAGAITSYYSAAGSAAFTLERPKWLATAVVTLWFHVDKTVLPTRLSPLYQLPVRLDLLEPRVLMGAVGALGITVVVVGLRRAWPAGLAVWMYYGLVLAPVAGATHAGPQLTADRYSYLACLGWALLVGAGAGVAIQATARGVVRPALGRLLAGVAVVAVVGLATLTWRQVLVWRDTQSLWRHAVQVTPECSTCRINFGSVLLGQRRYLAAIEQFDRALALRPGIVKPHGNIGLALAALGRFTEAIDHYERVLARYPGETNVRVNLAATLLYLGRLPEVVAQLREAVRRQKAGEATAYFRDAVARKPESPITRLGLLEAYLAEGKVDLAREQQAALRALRPDLARVAELIRGS